MRDLVLLALHDAELRALLHPATGTEAAAYVLFGRSSIAADPWTGTLRTRYVSHAVVPVPEEDRISASPLHVTWSTRGFVRLLSQATADNLVLGIAHSHPNGPAVFSPQDDRNEAELARAVTNRNGNGHELVSVLLGDHGGMAARVWVGPDFVPATSRIAVIGRRLRFIGHLGEHAVTGDAFDRQSRLFGPGLNEILHGLRIGVVGCGGTGSAVAMLLLRLGIGHLLLIDNDAVELTNLNRVHGARRSDVGLLKVDVLAREIRAAGLGVEIATVRSWAGAPQARDALKSCDLIFGCTDDHDGRALLSRLAYFYGIPVIDVGLRMRPAAQDGGYSMVARLSTVMPGEACLLCRDLVNPKRASEEHLERTNPEEFRRQKLEAYVEGAGDPAPAVVTFTTEAATMAVNEMLQGLTGFRQAGGMSSGRFRHFESLTDRTVSIASYSGCRVCDQRDVWGRADVEPFLHRAG